MNFIKQYIYRFLIKRLPARGVKFPHFERPLNILLIFESDFLEGNKDIKILRDMLVENRHSVSLWGYVDKKEIASPILPQSHIFGLNDFNFLGMPTPQAKQALQNGHFDILIDLSTKPILALQYIAAFTPADCKIGIYRENSCADVMINIPEDSTSEYLFNQIVKYLKQINSND